MNQLRKKEGFQGQKAIVIPSMIITKFFKEQSIIKQLYITDIGYYPNAEYHYRQRLRGAKQHIFIYCTGGKGFIKINHQLYTVSSGEFAIIPANTAHEYKADENNA